MAGRSIALFLFACALAGGQKHYTYVGRLAPDGALLAWGATEGRGNTIGRDSVPLGQARVLVGGRAFESNRNWVLITGLTPDREYSYELLLGGKRAGGGRFRTWPERSQKLAFFVIGDYGVGDRRQYEIAAAMWKEFEKRRTSDNPVRFVLTTGDNIYGWWSTGSRDSHWQSKFFAPYEPLLRQIPFYPTLGNHDGNSSESRADLAAYLDNFFFPSPEPARYYRFSFAGLADFFALDTTDNTSHGPPSPAFAPGGRQHRWLESELRSSRLPWKIPYFHHPPFSAGPRHRASLSALRHFVALFEQNGVKVVFNGHEHNFQISDARRTGGIRYVITGAGGELRRGDVASRMERAGIEGWAPAHHFLLVEIEGPTLKIWPLGGRPVTVWDAHRRELKPPFEVRLPGHAP